MNKRDFYAYSTIGVACGSICGILAAPTIPIAIAFTLAGSSYGLFSLNKLKKINEVENK